MPDSQCARCCEDFRNLLLSHAFEATGWLSPEAACKLHVARNLLLSVYLPRSPDDEGLGMAVTSLQQSASVSAPFSGVGAPAAQATTQRSQPPRQPMPFDGYQIDGFHDEMFLPAGPPR